MNDLPVTDPYLTVIKTRNFSKRAAALLRLWKRLNWRQNRHNTTVWTDSRKGSKSSYFIAHGSGYTEPDPTGVLVSQGTPECLAQQTRVVSSRYASHSPTEFHM
jgi:hypothetical protein